MAGRRRAGGRRDARRPLARIRPGGAVERGRRGEVAGMRRDPPGRPRRSARPTARPPPRLPRTRASTSRSASRTPSTIHVCSTSTACPPSATAASTAASSAARTASAPPASSDRRRRARAARRTAAARGRRRPPATRTAAPRRRRQAPARCPPASSGARRARASSSAVPAPSSPPGGRKPVDRQPEAAQRGQSAVEVGRLLRGARAPSQSSWHHAWKPTSWPGVARSRAARRGRPRRSRPRRRTSPARRPSRSSSSTIGSAFVDRPVPAARLVRLAQAELDLRGLAEVVERDRDRRRGGRRATRLMRASAGAPALRLALRLLARPREVVARRGQQRRRGRDPRRRPSLTIPRRVSSTALPTPPAIHSHRIVL